MNDQKDGKWYKYFAWFGVYVDAYDVSEIKNGKMSYKVFGWVERRWHQWDDMEAEPPEHHQFWRYRLIRK